MAEAADVTSLNIRSRRRAHYELLNRQAATDPEKLFSGDTRPLVSLDRRPAKAYCEMEASASLGMAGIIWRLAASRQKRLIDIELGKSSS